MAIFDREDEYLKILSMRPHTVQELATELFISEPTVRRDVVKLKKKELVQCNNGTVSLQSALPSKRNPIFIRENENMSQKDFIAKKAMQFIRDGHVLMLDSSTTAHALLPHLLAFKNLLIITNGAKTAIDLCSLGIKTVCTGGDMLSDCSGYVGHDAERTLRAYNADVAFFSCRALNERGVATDSSINENVVRKVMMQQSKRKYLLCDSSKLGNTHLHTLCHAKDIDGIICDINLPSFEDLE